MRWIDDITSARDAGQEAHGAKYIRIRRDFFGADIDACWPRAVGALVGPGLRKAILSGVSRYRTGSSDAGTRSRRT